MMCWTGSSAGARAGGYGVVLRHVDNGYDWDLDEGATRDLRATMARGQN